MNEQALKSELKQTWNDLLQDSLGASVQAEDLLERLTTAALLGRESEVAEIQAKLLLLREQANQRASRAQERALGIGLRALFQGVRAGIIAATACLVLLASSCIQPAGLVSKDNIRPAIERICDRHDRLIDNDPTNDPVPLDQVELDGWLETSRMLREVVGEETP